MLGLLAVVSPPRRRRALFSSFAVAFLATGAAACGGGGHSAGVARLGKPAATTTAPATPQGGSGGISASLVQESVAYARCMQKHGEPEFPDPDSAGTFRVAAIAALDRNSPQFQGALRSCLKLRPRATSQEIAQLEAQLLKFSACMRAHGEPTFPDFQLGGGVAARQAAQYLKTIDPNSPQFQSALATCRSLLPATIGDALAP